jgi:hypothetical protein
MSKALLVVPGKAVAVSEEVREQLVAWAAKGDFEVVWLDDSTIKELAGGPPVLFFPMTDRSLSVEKNVLALMEHIDAMGLVRNDLSDISDIIDAVQEETEADEKVPHLERGGFLGRGKRGAINYRRVK